MRLFPLTPLKVQDEYLVVDNQNEYLRLTRLYVDRFRYKMFRTKCKVGLLKNKVLAVIR